MNCRLITYALMALLLASCRTPVEPQIVAGYIVSTPSSEQITIEGDTIGVRTFNISDETIIEGGVMLEGNIAEIIYLPEESDKLPTAIEIATDDTYPRALGRWTNGEQNRLKIDIELLPNGHIRQHQPQQTVVFSSWQLTNKEDSITLSGTVSLPAAVEEKPKRKCVRKSVQK